MSPAGRASGLKRTRGTAELPSGWLKTDAQASEGQQDIIGFDPLRQTRSRAASRFPLYDYGRHASTAPSPSRLSVWSSIGSHSNVHFEERLAPLRVGWRESYREDRPLHEVIS